METNFEIVENFSFFMYIVSLEHVFKKAENITFFKKSKYIIDNNSYKVAVLP